MADPPFVWPGLVLTPESISVNPVFFSRSGGTTLGGIKRTTRTDRGHWSVEYQGIALHSPSKRRVWNAIRTHLAGTAGLIAIPAWSHDVNEWPAGSIYGDSRVTHSDGTPFGDGSLYSQPAVVVEMAAAAAIGDTTVTLRLVSGATYLTGVRFSYNHALYETGAASLIDDDEWTLDVFPAIRAAIPADAELELGIPTCLCHLAEDNGMDTVFSAGRFDMVNVAFVEAVDHWNDLAG